MFQFHTDTSTWPTLANKTIIEKTDCFFIVILKARHQMEYW